VRADRSGLRRRLTHLDLSRTCLHTLGLRRMLQAKPPWGLAALRLDRLRLTGPAARALAGCPALAPLRVLSLDDNQLDDAAAAALAASPHLAGLGELSLAGNAVGRAGAKALLSSPHLGRAAIRLSGNPITPEEGEGLRQRFGARAVTGGRGRRS
jgi:Leucine Rich repeat